MDTQKPIGQDRPSDCPPCPRWDYRVDTSVPATLMRMFELLLQHLLPPRWACLALITLTLIFFTPRLLNNWLDVLARLKWTFIRWQQGYDITQIIPEKPKA